MKEVAMLSRDAGDLDEALMILRDAEKLLTDELDQVGRQRAKADAPSVHERAIQKQLAHIKGSIGGVYRRQGAYASSIAAYDSGNEIERRLTGPDEDSYNLTQRLLSRVLENPAVGCGQEFEAAIAVIRAQQSASRMKDEYAAADLLTILLLMDAEEWRAALASFMNLASPSSYARKVTCETLADAATRLAASTTAAKPLRDRLELAVATLKS